MAGAHLTVEEVGGHFTIHYSLFTIRQQGLPSAYCFVLTAYVAWGFGHAALAKLIRPPSVHPHAFDALDSNYLNADIIAAIPVIGKRY